MEKSQLMRHSADTADAVLENVRSTQSKMVHMVIRFMSADAGEKKYQKAGALSKIFTSREEALDVVEKAILFFRDHGNKGERFAETIERIGFENVEKELIG